MLEAAAVCNSVATTGNLTATTRNLVATIISKNSLSDRAAGSDS